jgi:hypothetical protein
MASGTTLSHRGDQTDDAFIRAKALRWVWRRTSADKSRLSNVRFLSIGPERRFTFLVSTSAATKEIPLATTLLITGGSGGPGAGIIQAALAHSCRSYGTARGPVRADLVREDTTSVANGGQELGVAEAALGVVPGV